VAAFDVEVAADVDGEAGDVVLAGWVAVGGAALLVIAGGAGGVLLLDNQPLTIFGDGEQSRDFTHVDTTVPLAAAINSWAARLHPGEQAAVGPDCRSWRVFLAA